MSDEESDRSSVRLFSSGSSDLYNPSDSETVSSDPDLPGPSVKKKRVKKNKKQKLPTNTDESKVQPAPIKKNRKSVNPATWKRNIKKTCIAEGKSYVNWKGVNVGPRQTGPNCHCKFKCFEKVSEEKRKVVLKNFNEIGDKQMQTTYLGGLIETTNVARVRAKTRERKSRSCVHKYNIRLGMETVRVCRSAFRAMHGISKKRVDNIAKTFCNQNITPPTSKQGKHKNRKNRIPDDVVQKVNDHIKSFPRRESHYSRIKTARFYLSPDLNVKKMYQLYLQLNEPESITNENYKPKVTYDFYFRYFKQNFNYSFGSPRSDTCKKCDILHNKIKDPTLDANEKKELQKEKTLHEMKSSHFFKELKEKTKLSKENAEVEVLTFDYQQNLPLPKIPAGEAFYKRQLWTYNFCIHSGKTGKAHFYIYDETTARKSPNEVISFLFHYIDHILPKNVKVLYLFSDNAAAQNKNATILQFLHLLVRTTSLQKIEHRFPEPGHSFLPCDRCFGVIEKYLRKKDYVFSPKQYCQYIQEASKGFIPIMVHQGMILNFSGHFENHFKKVIMNAEKKRFKISQYRIFQYNNDHPHTIAVSVSTGVPIFESFQILRDTEDNLSVKTNHLVYNSPLPVKKAKYKDVMQLATNYVPQNEIKYYQALKSEDVGDNEHVSQISGTDDDDQADE